MLVLLVLLLALGTGEVSLLGGPSPRRLVFIFVVVVVVAGAAGVVVGSCWE